MTKGTKQPDQPLVRPVVWIAGSKDDLSTLPPEVKGSFGFRLYELQQGKTPLDIKPCLSLDRAFMSCERFSMGTPIG